ncbi:MAG: hypothetical protein K5982_01505 [Selenomonadaceae bacterium]|nr:hypothetical protein [Selenomonadaceae bacterium]
MNTREKELIDVLDELFPLFANGNGEAAEKKKRIYGKILRRMTAAELRAVLQFCLMRQNFIPTLYEIKAAMTQLAEAKAGYHTPTADEALAEVLQKAQSGRKTGYSTEIIEKTVKTIGFQNILCLQSGALEVFRAHWRRVYDTFIRRGDDDEVAENVLRALPPDAGGVLHDTIDRLTAAKVAALPSPENP